ncbi:MAG TPA: phage tail tape measure protein, partial [Ramlibacter sp.]|nr:phage tail tape measure protein [Ramlibacter sp.]
MDGLEFFVSSEKGVQAANAFTTAIDSAAAAVDRVGSSLSDLDARMAALGKTASGTASDQKKAGDATDKAGDKAKESATDWKGLADVLDKLGVSGDRTLLALKSLGAQVLGLLAFQQVVQSIGEFEDSMRFLRISTKATSAELRDMETAADRVTLATRFQFTDAARSLALLSRAGLDTKEAIAALPSVASLAFRGFVPLQDAAKGVSKILKQFSLDADEAGRVSAILADAATAGGADLAGLFDVLDNVGRTASEAGVGFEDLVASISLMQKASTNVRQGSGQLQAIIVALQKGGQDAGETLHRLGLTLEDIDPSNLSRALGNLAKQQITFAEASDLVGQGAAGLLLSLVRQREGFDKLASSVRRVSATDLPQAGLAARNLNDEFNQLEDAAKRFAVTTGDRGTTGAVKFLVRTLSDALNVLSRNEEAMKDAGAAGIALARAAEIASIALSGLVTARTLASLHAFLFAGEKSVGLLARIARFAKANPYIALASAIASVGTAFLIFGDNVDTAEKELQQFEDASER